MEDTVIFYGQTYLARYRKKRSATAEVIQDLFNDHEYWWRAAIEREFQLDVVYQDEASGANNQPPGTVSEIVVYHMDRSFFVRVHQYVLPYGEVDQWGRPRLGGKRNEPDPKEIIFEDGIWYWLSELRNVPKGIRTRRQLGL